MKKTTLFCVFATILAIGLASCEDSVRTSALTIDEQSQATVTAQLYAELDKTKLGLEKAPDGTVVFVSVNYNQLNPAAGAGSWMDTLYVQDGKVEANVPVASGGSIVTFIPDEFVASQIQPYGSNLEVIEKIFRVAAPQNMAGVRPGQSRIIEIAYADADFVNHVEKVEISFKGKAILADHFEDADTLVHIPQGTNIALYTADWAVNTTIGSEGQFSASIPKDEAITVEFISKKTITEIQLPDSIVTVKNLNYKYEIVTPTYSTSTPVTQDLNFGGGILWE